MHIVFPSGRTSVQHRKRITNDSHRSTRVCLAARFSNRTTCNRQSCHSDNWRLQSDANISIDRFRAFYQSEEILLLIVFANNIIKKVYSEYISSGIRDYTRNIHTLLNVDWGQIRVVIAAAYPRIFAVGMRFQADTTDILRNVSMYCSYLLHVSLISRIGEIILHLLGF